MTGESGTGKTLAAEVIAHTLSLHMLKIDLSRVVSKWVGESERNLELVFREAEETHSVLVFDECESLFGRRGEIQSGTDRYSNLEVGYLLQRLESFCGLAILTSNLKDQIDSAFTRRFQVVLHFPLPAVAERRRIWQLAFPSLAPVGGVDLEVLQSLDLSGAGIVASARIAALLAADERSECIGMSHVVKAVARQYQREARLLSATQLGRYATLL
jgi:SpoVK/Ycf46/Vps4 family AAA+-type ATPase